MKIFKNNYFKNFMNGNCTLLIILFNTLFPIFYLYKIFQYLNKALFLNTLYLKRFL